MELSNGIWKLAFSPGRGRKPRLRNVSAGNLSALLREIARAKQRFGLHEDAAVVCCYEAGRDGFWIHRFLLSQGIENRESAKPATGVSARWPLKLPGASYASNPTAD